MGVLTCVAQTYGRAFNKTCLQTLSGGGGKDVRFKEKLVNVKSLAFKELFHVGFKCLMMNIKLP